jgi:hypothetical protein
MGFLKEEQQQHQNDVSGNLVSVVANQEDSKMNGSDGGSGEEQRHRTSWKSGIQR